MLLGDPPLTGFLYMGKTSVRQPPTGGDWQDGYRISHFLLPKCFEGGLDTDESLVPRRLQLTSNYFLDHYQSYYDESGITVSEISPYLSENIPVVVASFQVNNLIL